MVNSPGWRTGVPMVPLRHMANHLFPNFRLKGIIAPDCVAGMERVVIITRFKRSTMVGAAGLLMALVSVPAIADTTPGSAANVKAGVDAWSRGEYKKAVEAWRPAAIAGDADAQFNLGQAYKLGRGVPEDLALAEEWYRKAALQGHYQAQDAYGLTLFQNNKRTEAVEWLERSAARGEPRAQLVLGTMLFNGDSVKKDWVRAYALLTRSSASGLPQGAQTLAQMDQYIPADTRQQGIALARDYEAAAARPVDVPEVAGQGTNGMVSAELPASTYAGDSDSRPALNPAPLPTRKKLPVASAAANPPSAVPATPKSVSGTGWRIQFGAFRDEGNARSLWRDLQAKVGSLTSLQPFYSRSGTLTKLQAGSLATKADADRICAAVRSRAAGTPCVIVAP